MKMSRNSLSTKVIVLWSLMLLMAGFTFGQVDKLGCKDPILLTRMPGFFIKECQIYDFNVAEFKEVRRNGGLNTLKVEGKYQYTKYVLMKGQETPSPIQIARNYLNAIRSAGGVVAAEESNGKKLYLKLSKGNTVYWIVVNAAYIPEGIVYDVTVVEKAGLEQEVFVKADTMLKEIQTKGRTSIYSINFDFNKADIKPESEPAIREIARLLQESRFLKLYVVGHTDNIGDIDYNLRLSKARADAVVRELVTKYGISPDRLKAYGVGSLAPIAPNKTEEGRTMNRRVELVEQ